METCTHAGNYNNYLEGCMNEQAAGTAGAGLGRYPCGGISCGQSAFARRRCPMQQQQQPNVTSQLTLITRRLRTAHPVEGGGGVGGADVGEGEQLIARLLCAAVQPCVASLLLLLCLFFSPLKLSQKIPKKFTSLRAPGCTCARLHVSMTLATSNMTTLLLARVHSSSVCQSRHRRRRPALFQFVAHCW